MRQETKSLVIMLSVCLIAIISLIFSGIITGAYTYSNVVCSPRYSEASGQYPVECYSVKEAIVPFWGREDRGESGFIPQQEQTLNQFPLTGFQRQWYPKEKIVYYYNNPVLITYKDSDMGSFPKETKD